MKERFGGNLWLHACALGEAQVAASVVDRLPADLPILVTTSAGGDAQTIARLFPSRAKAIRPPYDREASVRRFFELYSPRALVVVENPVGLRAQVLREILRLSLPVFFLNVTAESSEFKSLLHSPSGLTPLLLLAEAIGVQNSADREQLIAAGVEPQRIVWTGNLKYDMARPEPLGDLESRFRSVAEGRPIFIAGSIKPEECDDVLAAFESAGGGERALLILAPRVAGSWEKVAKILSHRGLETARRSELPALPHRSRPAVVLLDSLGELPALYRMAAGAFIGGTLGSGGGHNPLEPARWGVPVVAGPRMLNFRQIARQFDQARAWIRVSTSSELAAVFRTWLDDEESRRALGARGAQVAAASQGGMARTLEMLEPALALF
jgi:3-deoxy-D-manno-octulosonic-acid transferase